MSCGVGTVMDEPVVVPLIVAHTLTVRPKDPKLLILTRLFTVSDVVTVALNAAGGETTELSTELL